MKPLKLEIKRKNQLWEYATIDYEDYGIVSQYNLAVVRKPTGKFNVVCRSKGSKKRKSIALHRLIMNNPPFNVQVRHINNDPFDNRKSNLEICNKGVGMRKPRNKYGLVGIYKIRNPWRARIKVKDKRFYLGSFETKEEAADAYNKAAKQYYGEGAILNKI